MGLADGKIPNSALSSASEWSATYAASKGRLNHQSTYIAKRNDEGQWFQVDFGKIVKITSIITQGRHNAAQWVTKFMVSYSFDGGYFSFQLHHPYSVPREYYANRDRLTIVETELDEPIIARIFRVHPVEWGVEREVLAEEKAFERFQPPVFPNCMDGLGMEDPNEIPDSAITASSYYNSYYKPSQGRLYQQYEGGSGSWLAKTSDQNQWLQVNLGGWRQVMAFCTQGRLNAAHWLTSYSLAFSYDGVFYRTVHEVFKGNSDQFMPVCHSLRRGQVIARYVRIIPRTWHGYIACRAGFYGCKSGFEPPKLECQAELGMSSGKIPNSAITATTSYNQYYGPERARLNTIQLGMQNGKIPNSALTASSKWNANYGPENARLHFHPVSGRQGAWVARVQNVNQWLQVDFGVETQVTRIATQGRQNKNQYVTKYTLRYSLDKSQWNMYQPNGFTMTFPGNNDRYTVVSHNLPKPIRTRYLRIVPEEWYRYIALRAEFYGCKTKSSEFS
ncbi:Lactadherin [Stylophora pistillata]|uniref:Lactadherin n=1 Tax=Stylophora pistillata TaxID=50429 RepID=A0A2B4R8T0_STYPI|nr:Lactadherin [Stylophora pistillata]